MPPSDPVLVNTPPDVWTPVAVDGVSIAVNIVEAFADLVYYQTYRPTGGGAPDNTANPGEVDFEGVPIFNRRDRIAGKDVFIGGVEFQTSAGIDVYIYPLGKAGKVRVDSLAAGGDGGGAVSSVDTRTGDVTLGDLYETLFSKNTAFNKNFGSGAGQVAEGNALAVKITGPGSSQINQIFVAIDANGNAQMVPIKIDPVTRKVSLMGETEQDGDQWMKAGRFIQMSIDGKKTLLAANKRGRFGYSSTGLFSLTVDDGLGITGVLSVHPATLELKNELIKQSTSINNGASIIEGGQAVKKNQNIGGDLGVVGDIKTVAWTDYGGTSIIAGFSSVTTKAIWYKKVGKIVFVNYLIFGASNSVNFTFTLPFTSINSSNFVVRTAARVTENGSIQPTSGSIKLLQNSNIVNVYSDWNESSFTAGGSGKGAEGQFWYETT